MTDPVLGTKECKSEEKCHAEEVVDIIVESLTNIAKKRKPHITKFEDVKDVIKSLKKKKAKDLSAWKNSMIKAGGNEMIKSVTNIVNEVDSQMLIPFEWKQMEIKSIHKKGCKMDLNNKRGLFLTSNLSKVYEKLVKKGIKNHLKQE